MVLEDDTGTMIADEISGIRDKNLEQFLHICISYLEME